MNTRLSEQEFFESLPRKRIASTGVFWNRAGESLVVKPNYRDDWLIPGGSAEDGESPKATCEREVVEELGQQFVIGDLLCVCYSARREGFKGDSLHFLFDGGVLSDTQIEQIALPNDELIEYRFVEVTALSQYLGLPLLARVRVAFDAKNRGSALYGEIN